MSRTLKNKEMQELTRIHASIHKAKRRVRLINRIKERIRNERFST
jgi:hypothetical protein